MTRREQNAPLLDWERKACELYALQSYSKVEAYRSARRLRIVGTEERKNARKVQIQRSAKLFFDRLPVIEYVHDILRTARESDLLSVGKTLRELQDGLEAAQEDKNWTAFSQMLDKKLKVQGLMRERFVISEEEKLDDEALLERLAAGDVRKLRVLKRLLGSDSFEDAKGGGDKVVEIGRKAGSED